MGKRPPGQALLLSCALSAATWSVASAARADLRDDASRVARLWSAQGAIVRRLPPTFLEQGRAHVVDVDAEAPSVAGGSCLTLAALAPRTADFVVAHGPGDLGDMALLAVALGDGGPGRVEAGSGAVVVSRCGEEAERLARAVLLQQSPRSAIELLVARSPAPLPDLPDLLPERVVGPSAPRGTPGRSLEVGPIDARLRRAAARARAEGADSVGPVPVGVNGSGRGEVGLTLAPGCHRIEVFAEARRGPRFPIDVDAELRVASGLVLARDRGDATDARLDACVGEETAALLGYVGAPGAAALHVTDARWTLPATLPAHWGPRLRAAAFSAMLRRRMPIPSDAPLHESFGVQGSTPVPLSVEPGSCYLAVVGLAQGTARGMRLRAEAGARPAVDEAGQRPEGVAVTFCAEQDVVPITVDVQSSGGWWLLAVWGLGPRPGPPRGEEDR